MSLHKILGGERAWQQPADGGLLQEMACAVADQDDRLQAEFRHHLAAVMEKAVVEDGVSMGPFARLRKGAHLCKGVHMGNFGEVKDSTLGPGTKMGHFSYIGNATIAEQVNIGAGTITCNYDGVHKNPTEIGAGAFIGSDTMLVAPVKIGAGAKTGAGAVVTKDVEPDTLVVGVPARPIKKLNEAKDEHADKRRTPGPDRSGQ